MNVKKSGRGKHSYVPFYMDDWYGGTARMTRLVKSVYFDICLYIWDKAQAVPEAELMLMLDDLGPQGEVILNMLVKSGRLECNQDGSVYSKRALHEAEKAFSLWEAKSGGGKRGASATNAASTPVETVKENHTHIHTEKKEGKSSTSLSSDDDDAAPEPAATAKPKKEYRSQDIATAWNEMAAKHGFAQAMKITAKRATSLRVRQDDYPFEQIIEAISLVPKRPFCVKGKSWCTLDWFIRPDSVAKLIEGVAYTGGGSGSWFDA